MPTELSANEQWFDKDIVPLLGELERRCDARGLSFLALVDIEPGDKYGRNALFMPDCSLTLTMARLVVENAPSIDNYVAALLMHCVKNNIDLMTPSKVMAAVKEAATQSGFLLSEAASTTH